MPGALLLYQLERRLLSLLRLLPPRSRPQSKLNTNAIQDKRTPTTATDHRHASLTLSSIPSNPSRLTLIESWKLSLRHLLAKWNELPQPHS